MSLSIAKRRCFERLLAGQYREIQSGLPYTEKVMAEEGYLHDDYRSITILGYVTALREGLFSVWIPLKLEGSGLWSSNIEVSDAVQGLRERALAARACGLAVQDGHLKLRAMCVGRSEWRLAIE